MLPMLNGSYSIKLPILLNTCFKLKAPVNNIRDISESVMRRVVGDRLVTEVLTTGRVEIATSAKKLMQEILDHYDIGLRIVTMELQDVNPPELSEALF